MNPPFSGSCACGSVSYTCASDPVAMLNCHCSDCQRASGAPFASGIVVHTMDLEISGSPKAYAARASSGKMTTRGFCGDCGTPLFTQSEVNAQFTSIRFPTLDDASAFAPMLDIWTASAQPWVCLDEKLPHFAASPQEAG
ncbi:GFA family protein [Ramlibacter sp. PS3R-8]|uniref:GFA family protein n=1 Tax=Ramlibacter sp. PS3R-8 TaxID=3133437 RepID=UPI003095A3F8